MLFKIYSNIFQVFRMASLVKCKEPVWNSTRDNIAPKPFCRFRVLTRIALT